jgi:WhiB family transcriptional regulator, redox-sensing transcriptional regulator
VTAVAVALDPRFPGTRPDDGSPASWRARALCAETDPEAFFPEKGGSVREAKKVCRSCEVTAECLEYALENDERFGVWGGLSERERRRIGRPAAPADPVMCGTGSHPKTGPGDCAECRKEREQKRRKTPARSAPARSPAGTPGRQTTGTAAAERAWRPQGTYGWKASKKGIAA